MALAEAGVTIEDKGSSMALQCIAATMAHIGPGRIGRDAPGSRAQFFLDSHAEMVHMLQLLIDLRPTTKIHSQIGL